MLLERQCHGSPQEASCLPVRSTRESFACVHCQHETWSDVEHREAVAVRSVVVHSMKHIHHHLLPSAAIKLADAMIGLRWIDRLQPPAWSDQWLDGVGRASAPHSLCYGARAAKVTVVLDQQGQEGLGGRLTLIANPAQPLLVRPSAVGLALAEHQPRQHCPKLLPQTQTARTPQIATEVGNTKRHTGPGAAQRLNASNRHFAAVTGAALKEPLALLVLGTLAVQLSHASEVLSQRLNGQRRLRTPSRNA